MSKIEVVVTITADPLEKLDDLMVSAARRLIHPFVDEVLIFHNDNMYVITREKMPND